jgi:hypothetical protein
MWTLLLKPKNIMLAVIGLLIVALAGFAVIYSIKYEKALETIKRQGVVITAQSSQIDEYKKNI